MRKHLVPIFYVDRESITRLRGERSNHWATTAVTELMSPGRRNMYVYNLYRFKRDNTTQAFKRAKAYKTNIKHMSADLRGGRSYHWDMGGKCD